MIARLQRCIVLVLGMTMAVASLAFAQRGTVASAPPEDSPIVSAEWLRQHVDDPSVVVLFVVYPPSDSSYSGAHIPGARLLDYRLVQATRDGLHTELPEPDTLRALFEGLGVSDESRVVLYGFPPNVARTWLTLEYFGHARTSILDGGLTSWRAAGFSVSSAVPAIPRGHLTPHPHPEIVVDAAWITARAGAPGVALIDTRTDPEYQGTGDRHGIPSDGHIAGARQLQWQELFAGAPDEGRFLPTAELARTFASRAAPGDTVVTYCWVGQRASVTYFAARLLGYPTRFYDGSYEDWRRRQLPVTKGSAP